MIVEPVRDARRPVHEGFEVALGASDSEILKNIATRIHHRDDDCSERCAEGQCGGHRDQGDGIDAHPAGRKIANHGNAQHQDHGHGAGNPSPVGNRSLPHSRGR